VRNQRPSSKLDDRWLPDQWEVIRQPYPGQPLYVLKNEEGKEIVRHRVALNPLVCYEPEAHSQGTQLQGPEANMKPTDSETQTVDEKNTTVSTSSLNPEAEEFKCKSTAEHSSNPPGTEIEPLVQNEAPIPPEEGGASSDRQVPVTETPPEAKAITPGSKEGLVGQAVETVAAVLAATARDVILGR